MLKLCGRRGEERRPMQLEKSEDEASTEGNVRMGSRDQIIQGLRGHIIGDFGL